MQFTRLRLVGFKSFVERSELLIDEGLTGVVGPNGCGKSNLLEGLRWVMGETSYKNMRGSGMDDVIFSGTDARPSRNVAEVVLTLDNAGRTAPAAFNDNDILEISRRIERDKGSDYKINNQPVRAKDVQLLFADASTGSRSPALVQQGRIGEIVNSKPQSRRIILEEAAGISGLYSRRHEAELRLNNTENNLERLADIQAQLSTQLGSLKRQARQATHYKDLSGKIRKQEAIILYLKWQQAHQETLEAEQAYSLALQQVGEQTQAEAKLRLLQEDQASVMNPLREQEAIAAAILQKLTIEHNSLKQEEQRQSQRQEELEIQHSQLQQDLEREKSQILEAEDSLTRIKSEKEALGNEDSSMKEQEKARLHVEETLQHMEQEEERLSVLSTNHAQMSADIKQAQSTLLAEQNKQQSLQQQSAALQELLEDLGHSSPLQQSIHEQKEIIEQASYMTEETEEELQSQNVLLGEYENQKEEKQDLLNEAKLEVNALETEVMTLEKLLTPSDENSQTSNLLNQIEVQAGYESAVAAAFGDDLEASLCVQSPTHWVSFDKTLDSSPSVNQFDVNIIPLSDVVTAPNQLTRSLSYCAVIAQSDGPKAQSKLLAGQQLVSQQGDLWRWDGFSRSAQSVSNAARKLEERNKLDQLKQTVAEKENALDDAQALFDDIHMTLEATKVSKDEILYRLEENRAQYQEAQSALLQAERALADLNQNQASHKATLQSLQEQLSETIDKINAIPPTTDHDRALEDMTQDLDFCHDNVQESRHNHAESKALLGALERENQQRNSRLETLEHDYERWQNRHLAAKSHIEELEERFETLSEELALIEALPDEILEKKDVLLTKIATAEKERQQAADTLQQAQNQLHDHDKAMLQLQNDLGNAKEERAKTEARLESRREKRAETVSQIREALNCLPEGCLQIAQLSSAEDVPSLDETEKSLVQLKTSRDKLGSINLRADLELKELEQQFDSMMADRDDLEQAIAKLRRSITDLNKEGRAKLFEAFKMVDGHFQKLFSTLFNGGTAKLELVESDDPLKAGLEIIARPPGKKPQVLSLLSGGEKALTALSLIFAVFLTNPSPICVLDEVDAPLDDANVGRFCNLLDEMKTLTDTRFLVITHHPQTMARMNRLFGVTMAEKGVSVLVSVDLEDAERLRDTG